MLCFSECMEVLVHNLGKFLGEIRSWPSYMKGKERPKEEADHSRLVGDSLNKQGNSHTRFVLGGLKTRRSLPLPARILKV